MISKLIDSVLKNRGLVLVALISILGLGVYEYRQLDVEAMPDFSPIVVPVFAEADGMAPEEVEQLITYPIEAAMNGLPHVDLVKSTSAFGMSVVYVYFDDNTDIYFARQLVSERLNSVLADLPAISEPPALGPISTGLGQIFLYYLELEKGADTGGMDELTYLRDLNDWVVKRQLQTVRGVTEILSAGGHVLQYQIEVDPFLLQKYELSIEDISTAVQSNNRNVGGQYLPLNSEEHLVRGVGLLRDVEDIGSIALKTVDGTPISISDVATVKQGREVRRGAITMGDGDEVVAGIVMKLYGANANQVISELYEKVEQVQAGLPDGVKLVPYYEQADLVTNATQTVKTALLQGTLLVLLVLILFLGSFRAALIVALSMPFCALVAVIGMNHFGVSANLMSLGGIAIALGMLVDGAIVVTENIHRIMGERGDEKLSFAEKMKIVSQAANEVGRPIAYAIMIVITVFLPILSLQATEGKMFKPLAYTVMLALGGSIIYALVVTPVLASFLIRPKKHAKEPVIQKIILAAYRKLLEGALKLRVLVFVAVVAVIAFAAMSLKNLGTEFIPVLDEGALSVDVSMAPSIALEEAEKTIKTLSKEIMKVDGVENAIALIGRPEAGSHPHPVNFAMITVTLNKKSEKARITEDLRSRLDGFPGVQINFSQPIQHIFDEMLSGSRAQLAIKVYGEDLDEIRASAESIRGVLEPIPGLVDVSTEQSFGQPQFKLILNRDACSRFGIAGEVVLEQVETAIGGAVIDTLYKNTRRYGIHLRYAPEFRSTPEALGELFIRSDDGALVPLDQLVTIERVDGPLQINRENNQRRWLVQANIQNRALSEALDDIQTAIAEKVDLPSGVFVEYGGQFEQQNRAMQRLNIIVPIVISLIFLLLWIAFKSLRYATMIMLNVPLALIGGVFGLLATAQYLSVPASIGFIALFGIAMQDAMVMLTDFNDLRKSGKSVRDAVISGSLIRFRPVIMTTLTTLFGLAPLLLSHGAGAEVQRPLAAVVIYGLATSTLLTLFVLPCIYLSVEEKRKTQKS